MRTYVSIESHALLAQLVEAFRQERKGSEFESLREHHVQQAMGPTRLQNVRVRFDSWVVRHSFVI